METEGTGGGIGDENVDGGGEADNGSTGAGGGADDDEMGEAEVDDNKSEDGGSDAEMSHNEEEGGVPEDDAGDFVVPSDGEGGDDEAIDPVEDVPETMDGGGGDEEATPNDGGGAVGGGNEEATPNDGGGAVGGGVDGAGGGAPTADLAGPYEPLYLTINPKTEVNWELALFVQQIPSIVWAPSMSIWMREALRGLVSSDDGSGWGYLRRVWASSESAYIDSRKMALGSVAELSASIIAGVFFQGRGGAINRAGGDEMLSCVRGFAYQEEATESVDEEKALRGLTFMTWVYGFFSTLYERKLLVEEIKKLSEREREVFFGIRDLPSADGGGGSQGERGGGDKDPEGEMKRDMMRLAEDFYDLFQAVPFFFAEKNSGIERLDEFFHLGAITNEASLRSSGLKSWRKDLESLKGGGPARMREFGVFADSIERVRGLRKADRAPQTWYNAQDLIKDFPIKENPITREGEEMVIAMEPESGGVLRKLTMNDVFPFSIDEKKDMVNALNVVFKLRTSAKERSWSAMRSKVREKINAFDKGLVTKAEEEDDEEGDGEGDGEDRLYAGEVEVDDVTGENEDPWLDWRYKYDGAEGGRGFELKREKAVRYDPADRGLGDGWVPVGFTSVLDGFVAGEEDVEDCVHVRLQYDIKGCTKENEGYMNDATMAFDNMSKKINKIQSYIGEQEEFIRDAQDRKKAWRYINSLDGLRNLMNDFIEARKKWLDGFYLRPEDTGSLLSDFYTVFQVKDAIRNELAESLADFGDVESVLKTMRDTTEGVVDRTIDVCRYAAGVLGSRKKDDLYGHVKMVATVLFKEREGGSSSGGASAWGMVVPREGGVPGGLMEYGLVGDAAVDFVDVIIGKRDRMGAGQNRKFEPFKDPDENYGVDEDNDDGGQHDLGDYFEADDYSRVMAARRAAEAARVAAETTGTSSGVAIPFDQLDRDAILVRKERKKKMRAGRKFFHNRHGYLFYRQSPEHPFDREMEEWFQSGRNG